MNEPLFKNSFVRDEQAIKEAFKNYYFKSKAFKVIYWLYPIALLLSLRSFILDGSSSFSFWLVYGIVFAILISVIYKREVKTAIMRDKELGNGKEMLMDLTVYDDRIELLALENKQTLYFADAKAAFNGKDYINIITKAKYIYTFKKDSFTLGTSDEFLEFLKSKGIKIQK